MTSDYERALLERFLRAEAMALWAVRAAQAVDVPPDALKFLRRHEEEEAEHLAEFQKELGVAAREKSALPRVPKQWHALCVQLYGYESLGLEFAKLLADVRPDLAHILEDEKTHVGFFEREVRKVLDAPGRAAAQAREFAKAWFRKVPRTVERYVAGLGRDGLRDEILAAIEARFRDVGLLSAASRTPG
ncbi:MAG TPA: hypothetical protein VF950_01625 [Planctomycetota bacterium]